MAQRPSFPPHSPSWLPSAHRSSASVLCGLSAGTHGGKDAKGKKKKDSFFFFNFSFSFIKTYCQNLMTKLWGRGQMWAHLLVLQHY